jgi:hypothetical protein
MPNSLLNFLGDTSPIGTKKGMGSFSADTWKDIGGAAYIASGIYGLTHDDYSKEAENNEAAVKTEQMEQETAARQQGLAHAKQVRQIMANQIASAAAHGVSAASPSVQRVSESSYNAFLQDNDVEALNISMSETVAQEKIANIRAQQKRAEDTSWFDSITSIGLGVASILLL